MDLPLPAAGSSIYPVRNWAAERWESTLSPDENNRPEERDGEEIQKFPCFSDTSRIEPDTPESIGAAVLLLERQDFSINFSISIRSLLTHSVQRRTGHFLV
ncbi:hypothetical protein XENOCAPTIV_026789 [Xenoophorus captivus]|uniref:Uncharacterized protein n=1 Tax=Xenoophorus captivus TaxID=1517983 RepID=A0ABV0S3C1_9TELE